MGLSPRSGLKGTRYLLFFQISIPFFRGFCNGYIPFGKTFFVGMVHRGGRITDNQAKPPDASGGKAVMVGYMAMSL